jgi:hypothetical protein
MFFFFLCLRRNQTPPTSNASPMIPAPTPMPILAPVLRPPLPLEDAPVVGVDVCSFELVFELVEGVPEDPDVAAPELKSFS